MNFKALALCALLAFQDTPKPRESGVDRLLRAVPADAVFVFSTDDFDSIREQLEGNAWWKFAETESMQGWIDGLWSSIESADGFAMNVDAGADESEPTDEAKSEDAARAREVMEQARAFMHTVHGPCVGFVSFTSFGDEPEGFGGVLVDPGAERAAFEGWVDRFLEENLGSRPSETSAYEGTELRLYERGNDAAIDAADAPEAEQLLYFEHAGVAVMLLSDKREQLMQGAHGVLDRLRDKQGSSGALDNPRFQSARAGGASKGRIEFLCDLGRLTEFVMRDDPSSEEDARLMQLFGLQDLTWMRARCDIGEGEQLDFEMALELPKQGALGRILTHLRPCSEAFVRSIPRDATSIGLFGIDVAGLWKTGWSIAAEIDPEAAAEARKQVEGAGQMLGGVDVEADFIEQLSGDFATFTVAVSDEEWRAAMGPAFEMLPEEMRAALERAPKVGNAFVIGLEDGKVVEDFVEKVLEASGVGANIEVEEFQGDTVNVLEIPGVGTRFSWVFQDHRAVLSQYPTALRALLSYKPEEGQSIYQHARLGPQLATNKNAAFLSLASTPDTLKALSAAFGGLGAMLPDNPASNLFTSGFPPPEVIERLFSGTMLMSLTRTPSQLSLRMATR